MLCYQPLHLVSHIHVEQIMDKHLVLKVDLGGGDNTLSLSQVMVSDGDWHSVSAVNYANQVTSINLYLYE